MDAVGAIDDFCDGFPGKEDDYFAELRLFVLRLYARRARPGAKYFLDKTPRYHTVASEIVRLFPDAPCIFLWRNPLAIIASMIETWGHGRWNLYYFDIDLFDGLAKLVEVQRKLLAQQRGAGNVCAVRFEELVAGSNDEWQRLFTSLGLEFDEAQLSQFKDVQLQGRMGDPTGRKQYRQLSTEPLDKWKDVLATPMRKAWCRRYLRWIGAERLSIMGYDLAELLQALDAAPTKYRFMVSDLARMAFAVAYRVFEPWIIRDKFRRISSGKRLVVHS